jgi:hypothetical protein
MACNLNGLATDAGAGYNFANPFRRKSHSLLKSYIDSQLLLIRLENLKKQGSTRDLTEDEGRELEKCVAMYKDVKRPRGANKVSEQENDGLVNEVKTLLQDVQQKHWGDAFSEHDVANLDVTEARTGIPEKAANTISMSEKYNLLQAALVMMNNPNAENNGSAADKEKLRKGFAILERAGEQPGGGLVASMLARAMAAQGPRKAEGAPATAQWVRYLDSASNDYYFVNAASNATVWDLPAGDTCIDENGVRVSPTSGGNGTKARFQILNPYLVSRGSVSE